MNDYRSLAVFVRDFSCQKDLFFRHMSRRGSLGRPLISPQAIGRANGFCEISGIGHVVERSADRGVSGSRDPYADIGMLRPKRDPPFGSTTHWGRKPNNKIF